MLDQVGVQLAAGQLIRYALGREPWPVYRFGVLSQLVEAKLVPGGVRPTAPVALVELFGVAGSHSVVYDTDRLLVVSRAPRLDWVLRLFPELEVPHGHTAAVRLTRDLQAVS